MVRLWCDVVMVLVRSILSLYYESVRAPCALRMHYQPPSENQHDMLVAQRPSAYRNMRTWKCFRHIYRPRPPLTTSFQAVTVT